MPGYLSLVLHAHLPFVRHPEHEKFLEESWLFEGITETYLPLIQMLNGWQRDQLGRAAHASRSRPRSARCCGTICCANATPGIWTA